MKTLIPASILQYVFVLVLFNNACKQTDSEIKEETLLTDEPVLIENTLKSVSLWNDSLAVEPTELLAALERMNTAIDSIGYPYAGYKLWIVKSDSSLGFRYMIEGYWPDQATYTDIHNHELYKTASKEGAKLFEKLKQIQYNRFEMVK